MATADSLRPFIEQEIAHLLGVQQAPRDADGDIPVLSGSSITFVRVLDSPTGAMIRFFSPVLKDVPGSTELLVRLNQLNARTPYVRFFWSNGHVFCSMEISGENVQWEELGNAITAVTAHADNIDDLLKRDFGGSTMMSEADAPKPSDVGGYL